MTAVPSTRRTASRQKGLKGLAGALSFVCLVLFLLAIEQKQAVEAWTAVRDNAVPVARRITTWVADGATDGLAGLKGAATGIQSPAEASRDSAVLAGEFAPADEATRQAVGGVTFVRARIQFEAGETLQTRPLRIAAGREVFLHGGQTFAGRLSAPDDAQIELRQVIAAPGQRAVPVSALCGGARPGAVALLHRRDRVDLLLFRERTIIGPDAPVTALCGVWSFRAR